MDSRRIDRFLMGLGVLLILISSYQLFFRSLNENDGVVLGTLTSTLSIVKTKNALALDWRDAISGNELTENQLIYTDSNSRADVTFKSGSALSIGESSLVKLKSLGKEESLDLAKGFIRAKLEGGQPLTVQMNGESYQVSGENADIQINLNNNKGEIGVLSGEIKIEAESGLSESIDSNTAMVINGTELTKKAIYFSAKTPRPDELKYVTQIPTNVSFIWTPAEVATVHLSRSASMDEAETFSGESGINIPLKAGLYYYKIESAKGSSLVSPFKIIEEVSPTLIRPLTGQQVEVDQDQESSIHLQWKNDERLKYLLEWNDGTIHSKEVSGSSALVKISHNGNFSWRIKINQSNRPEALWSEWQQNGVSLIPIPDIPTALSPNEVEYQTYGTPDEKIELSWKANSEIELEIIDPNEKSNSQKVTASPFEINATSAGTYKWRVRGLNSHLRNSPWTEWKTFHIEDLSKEVNKDGFQRIQLKKPDQAVTFSWKADGSESSVFELAKDAGFKQIVKKIEVNKDTARVNIPETGAFYWRSRQYLKDGTFNVSEPKKVIIEPVPAPEKPEKLPDMEVPIEQIPTTTTSVFEIILNFILPTAYAEDLKGQVHIDLPIKEDAKGYVIRLYQDQELTKLVHESEINSKKFEWKNAIPGNYFWHYAIIDYWDRKSPFSDPAVLVITGELADAPEKVKLKSPIRAIEVHPSDLILRWTTSTKNHRYEIEISDDPEFTKIISQKKTKKDEQGFTDLQLEPKLHYWRVRSLNKNKLDVLSNTGRFIINSSLEKTTSDIAIPFEKVWKSRGFVAWAPSKDNYTFKDDKSGTIDGTAIMGMQLSGTIFREKYIFNAEVLRQTGEVYAGESYLFQRLLLDVIKSFGKSHHHKWGVGLAVGQSSGNAYEIAANNVVTGKSVSGFSYGVALKNYYSINEIYEMQGRALYLLGEIKQIEIGADLIKHKKKYLMLGGLGIAMREYELNSGKQTSIKISLGIGKEF